MLAAVLTLSGCGTPDVEVSGSAPDQRVQAYDDMAAVALQQVEDLWGEGSVSRPVEVLLPGTAAEFAELTGGAAASQQAPAVTVGSLAEAHIVVHPDSWDRLTPEGRQAVLTHEVTHLSQQGDGPVPPWLGEGLAEFTAHRGSTLPPTAIAGSALDGVRAGHLPTDWPDLSSPGPDSPGQTGTGASTDSAWGGYALSWLACVYIAEEWSTQDLLDLYAAVSAGTALPDAVPQVLGISEEQAIAGWGAWLRDLTG